MPATTAFSVALLAALTVPAAAAPFALGAALVGVGHATCRDESADFLIQAEGSRDWVFTLHWTTLPSQCHLPFGPYLGHRHGDTFHGNFPVGSDSHYLTITDVCRGPPVPGEAGGQPFTASLEAGAGFGLGSWTGVLEGRLVEVRAG